MSWERVYRCKTAATMARRAVSGPFYADTSNQLVFSHDPYEVVVVVDTHGPISAVTNKQAVRVSVLPHQPMSQEVAERIWQLLEWEDVEGDDWIDPADVDVAGRGWDCRMKYFY